MPCVAYSDGDLFPVHVFEQGYEKFAGKAGDLLEAGKAEIVMAGEPLPCAGQDLLQLINAGYNPLQDIAEMTGQTMEQVRDQMSDGAIGIDMVRKAFVRATSEGGRYYGMIDKLAESPAGKFGEMKDTALEAMLALYNIIQPVIVPVFETLTGVLNAVTPAINAIASAANWVFNLFRNGNPIVWGLTAAIGAYTAAGIINTSVLKGWRIAELAHYAALLLVEKGQKLLNLAMTMNPIGLIIAGIAALVAVIVTCWNKFAGFRAVILTVWDTMKGFAGLIKDLVISRIQSLLQSIKVGEALVKLFRGDFSGAWQSAKEAGSLFLNVDGARQAVSSARNIVSGIPQNFQSRLDTERTKQKAKDAISDPEAAAGVAETGTGTAAVTAGGSGTVSAKDIANNVTTGGTRNTQISIRVDKFFEGGVTVQSSDTTDMSELRRKILECINRSLEIALSAAR